LPEAGPLVKTHKKVKVIAYPSTKTTSTFFTIGSGCKFCYPGFGTAGYRFKGAASGAWGPGQEIWCMPRPCMLSV